MRKILCVIQNSILTEKSGGYEIQIFNLMTAVRPKGWEIRYVTESPEEKEYQMEGIDVRTSRPRYYLSFWNPRLSTLLDDIPASVIYQRSRTSFSSGGWGFRIAKRKRIPFIFSIGSADDLMRWFMTKSLWTSEVGFLKKILLTPDALLRDWIFEMNHRRADVIIAQSEAQRQIYREQFGVDPVVVRSGHPVPKVQMQKSNPMRICWIANVRPLKQPELFLELARRCEDLSSTVGVQFTMVLGSNMTKYEGTNLLESLRRQPNIEVLGPLTIEEANDLLGKSSILVNTSIYEGFSNTYVQAWMRRTPVVTLQCDPDGLIEKNNMGFHSRTFDRLVHDVRRLIVDSDLLSSMAARAASYANDNHDIEKIADQFLGILERVSERSYQTSIL